MRRFIVLSFLTLDGIMQAPGGPEEDPSNGFTYGGWTAPFDDEEAGNIMQKFLEPADLLLGRKTFDIWENYWPSHASFWPGINEVKKYVLSTTRNSSEWNNCSFLNNLENILELHNSSGSDIKIWGSSQLVHLLLKHGLVDEFWLMIHPVILGKGKRLFAENALPKTYKLMESHTTSMGVIIANYHRQGGIITGRVGG